MDASAVELDIFEFLRTRNIPENIINQLKDDKIDINVINCMTDEELGQYLLRYGDRLALRAFCRQRTLTNEPSEGARAAIKSTVLNKLRDKLRGQRNIQDGLSDHLVGNTNAKKHTRRVEMGWLHYDMGDYHQVRTRYGGGTRHLSVQKTMTMGELLEVGKGLFFPNGHSPKGSTDDFIFDIRDFSHKAVPLDSTVNQLYEDTKLRMLRIYTCSKKKEVPLQHDPVILSDTSSDFEPTKDRSMKTRKVQRWSLRNRTRRYHHRSVETDDEAETAERSSELDPASSKSAQEHEKIREWSRHSPPDSPDTEHRDTPCEDVDNHTCQSTSRHEPSNQDGSSFAFAIQASLDDFEVQFGPVSGLDSDDQDSTLPWNQDDVSAIQHSTPTDEPMISHIDVPGLPDHPENSSGPHLKDLSEKEVQHVTVRRVTIVEDVMRIFMEPKVLDVHLIIKIRNEKAVDSDGVSREVYSAFWEHFLEQCEGEDERVPRLRPDYSEVEWQAIGRIWLKGYLDHSIIPIRLSPAFVLACCHGVSSVDEELLMLSFTRYLSFAERTSVEKAMQGNMDETDEDELLDLFSRMGSHYVPSKDGLRAAILTMAHKALLQEPKFIIDCFHTTIHNDMQWLITRDNIIELYESKRATNKKVAQIIKPSNEILNPQEQTALNYLLRYVKNMDQRKLETFLRFCTGSTVMCKDKIEITFTKLCGLSHRPVAHTCGAVLELPCTYSSYPEFRAELDNVLSGDCFAMDIV